MSQAGEIDVIGTHPEIPILFVTDDGDAVPIANTLEILGSYAIAQLIPVRTTGSGNTVTVEVQLASANASSVVGRAGLASFNSADFSVDANGFVSSTPGPSVITIDGDSGSATGNTIDLVTGNATNNSGASIAFVAAVSTVTLNLTDASQNTLVGKLSGNATLSGVNNTAFGYATGHALTSGNSNNFFGKEAGTLVSSGGANNLFGTLSGTSLTTGSDNVFMGQGVGQSLQSGDDNTMLGYGIAQVLISGSYNIILGSGSGSSYTTSESSNILLSNVGVVGESHVMRLGTDGSGSKQVNKCYVAGINGNTLVSPNFVTIDTSTGQLGTVSSSGVVETITGDSGGALSPTTGNFNIFGLSGSKTSGSGSTLIVKSPPYADASSSATSILNTGEFVTGAFTRTLPVSAGLADGDLFEYTCTSASQLTIQAVGAQQIRIGSAISSAAGTAKSNAIGDSISLRFRAADGFFYATSVVGTWTTA